MESVWRNLIESWRSQHLPIQKACKEDDVSSFETMYKLALAADMREYFLNVNGMTPYFPGYQDERGFSFWPLERMRTIAESNNAPRRSYLRLAEENSFFFFGDYMDSSWAYAVKIPAATGVAEGIYLVCCHDPIKIADSFSHFVGLYLEQSERLHPPAAHEHV